MPIKKAGSADVSEGLSVLRETIFADHLAQFGVDVQWYKRTADVSDATTTIADAYGDRDYTADESSIGLPFDPAVYGEQPPIRVLTELPLDLTPRLTADIIGGAEVVYTVIDCGVRVGDKVAYPAEAGGERRWLNVTRHLTHLGLYTEISLEGTR